MFYSLQSYVYDHAWCTKTGFHHGNVVYVGMFSHTAKDSRRVPYIDEEVNDNSPSTTSRFNSSNLIQLGVTPQ